VTRDEAADLLKSYRTMNRAYDLNKTQGSMPKYGDQYSYRERGGEKYFEDVVYYPKDVPFGLNYTGGHYSGLKNQVVHTRYAMRSLQDNPNKKVYAIDENNVVSKATEMDVLIAGMHDNLITTMSQLSSLRIISKTSTLKYADKAESMQEVARELDVDALIEASVLKAGDSVRINVQLIQAFPDEKHVWAKVFDKPFKNILGLYNEVTRSITDEINITLNQRRLCNIISFL